MSATHQVLVIADWQAQAISPQTHRILAAAHQLSESVDILVAGYRCRAQAESLASLSGVSHVLALDSPYLARGLVEIWPPPLRIWQRITVIYWRPIMLVERI